MYIKNIKKSIHLPERIDLFLLIAVLFLIIVPLIINLSFKRITPSNQVNLYLSSYFEDVFGKDLTGKLLQSFEEKNPGIKVRLAGDDTEITDILFFNEGDFNTLISAQSLGELNSFTNFDSGKRQMAIPLVSFMNMLFYNIDILTLAGFNSPPKNREEFLAYSRAVFRGNFGVDAAAMSLSRADGQALSRDIFSWIFANGGSLWSENDKPVLNNRTFVNDINYLNTFNREGLFTLNIFDSTGAQRLEQFAAGKLAMMVASTQVIPYLRDRMGDEAFGITTIPYTPIGGRYSIDINALYAGINAQSIHPDEAWLFLVHLTENSPFLCAELKAIPGLVTNITPGDYVMEDPFYSKAWDIFESSQIVEGFSGKTGALEYESIFLYELQLFFESNRSALDTFNTIQRRWDALGD